MFCHVENYRMRKSTSCFVCFSIWINGSPLFLHFPLTERSQILKDRQMISFLWDSIENAKDLDPAFRPPKLVYLD